MANAKKCDRCGKYYDRNLECYAPGTVASGVSFTRVDGYIGLKFDLCDSCIIDFKKFMRGDAIDEIKED